MSLNFDRCSDINIDFDGDDEGFDEVEDSDCYFSEETLMLRNKAVVAYRKMVAHYPKSFLSCSSNEFNKAYLCSVITPSLYLLRGASNKNNFIIIPMEEFNISLMRLMVGIPSRVFLKSSAVVGFYLNSLCCINGVSMESLCSVIQAALVAGDMYSNLLHYCFDATSASASIYILKLNHFFRCILKKMEEDVLRRVPKRSLLDCLLEVESRSKFIKCLHCLYSTLVLSGDAFRQDVPIMLLNCLNRLTELFPDLLDGIFFQLFWILFELYVESLSLCLDRNYQKSSIDAKTDFVLSINLEAAGRKDRKFWTDGYSLKPGPHFLLADVSSVFLNSLRTINVLNVCDCDTLIEGNLTAETDQLHIAERRNSFVLEESDEENYTFVNGPRVDCDSMQDYLSYKPVYVKKYKLFEFTGNSSHLSISEPLPSIQSLFDAERLSVDTNVNVLIKKGYIQPILQKCYCINNIGVQFVQQTAGLSLHLEVLRSVMLCGNDNFVAYVAERLFRDIAVYGMSPFAVLTPATLNPILDGALQTSILSDTVSSVAVADVGGLFAFTITTVPEKFDLKDISFMNCLKLEYKPAWPLNIIITENTSAKYSNVFQLMLSFQWLMCSLKHSFQILKSVSKRSDASITSSLHKLYLFRHEMNHVVQIMYSCLLHQIVDLSWTEFQSDVAKVENIEQLRDIHELYLEKVLNRALLDEKSLPLMKVIHQLLSIISRFRYCLIKIVAEVNRTQYLLKMELYIQTFHKRLEFLLSVLKTLWERGYQTNLEDLMLRLNFNSVVKMVRLLSSTETSIEGLNGAELWELSQNYIKLLGERKISNNDKKLLQLLPQLLAAISNCERIKTASGLYITGLEARHDFLQGICLSNWNEDVALSLPIIMRDVTFLDEEHKTVADRLLATLKQLPLEHLSAFTQQFLIFCSNFGMAQFALCEVSDIFNSLNGKQSERFNTEKLRKVEGAVVLHIANCAKQCQDMGKTLLKLTKIKRLQILSKFNFSVLLSLCQVQRFQEQILDLLKSEIFHHFKDYERLHQSKWARKLLSQDADLAALATSIIEDSNHNMDCVLEGLYELGFLLLDTHLSKVSLVAGRIYSEVCNPFHAACRLGKQILLKCFQLHHSVRKFLLERVLRILMKGPSTGLYFIELLGPLVEIAPETFDECSSTICELIDYLSNLPSSYCGPLLKVLMPVIKLRPVVRDTLVMALRKCAFSREVDCRKAAVFGFLQLLKTLNIVRNFSSSQMSQSHSFPCFSSQILNDVTSSAFNKQSNLDSICLEIVGCLKRLLNQQAEVRQLLYTGLYDVIKRNRQLLQPTLDLLYRQFHIYFISETEAAPVPLQLDSLVIHVNKQEPVLVEPLSHLVQALMRGISVAFAKPAKASNLSLVTESWDFELLEEDDFVDMEFIKKCHETLVSFASRMSTLEPEDFGLDKSADYSTASPTGIKNSILAFELLYLLEVLIEFVWKSNAFASENCEVVMKLYSLYAKLNNVLKEKAVSSVGKKISTNATAATTKPAKVGNIWVRSAEPKMSLGCLRLFLERLLYDQHPTRQVGLSLLRQNSEFIKWLYESADKKIQFLLQNPSHFELARFDNLFAIARFMLQHYGNGDKIVNEMKRVRLKQLNQSAVEILSAIFDLITRWFPDHLEELLDALGKESDLNRSTASNISFEKKLFSRYLKPFHAQLMKQFTVPEEDIDEEPSNSKIGLLLVHIVGSLVSQIPLSANELRQYYMLLKQSCQETTINDSHLSKAVLLLLFNLDRQCEADSDLLIAVAENLRSKLGDLCEQNPKKVAGKIFAAISGRSLLSSLMAFVSLVDNCLDDIVWLIPKMKSLAIPDGDVTVVTDRSAVLSRNDLEIAVSRYLEKLTKTLSEIVQCSMLISVADSVIKSVTKFYNAMSAFIKYLIAKYQSLNGAVDITVFEGLITLSGKNLTRFIYPFLEHIQSKQQEVTNKKKAADNTVAAKAKVMREMKHSSDLVFAIEAYESATLQLSKKCKKNLTAHFKLSTCRDFRIDMHKVQKAIENDHSSDEEEVITASADAAGPSLTRTSKTNARINNSIVRGQDEDKKPSVGTKRKFLGRQINQSNSKKKRGGMS